MQFLELEKALRHRCVIVLPSLPYTNLSLARSLAGRMTRAIEDGMEQCNVFTEFTQSLKEVHAEDLARWSESIEGWEKSGEGDNPYERIESGESCDGSFMSRLSLTSMEPQLWRVYDSKPH